MKTVKLDSVTKDYIWGGKKLYDWGFKPVREGAVIAEAWTLSLHKDGESTIAGSGQKLSDVTTRADFGSNCDGFENFPVLIKLIDSADNLSVQVHPSDEYALKHEGQFGKTEMWYVIESEQSAGLYVGFKRDITEGELAAALSNGTVTELMNFFEVKSGDCYFIPAGTVHAIGKGCTIAEIQQNSNLTYRVYDYNRLGADGKPRELHIDKALKVAGLNKYEPVPCASGVLASCRYFTARKLKGSEEIYNTRSFTSVLVLADGGTLDGAPLKRGDSYFIPAGVKATLQDVKDVIITTV